MKAFVSIISMTRRIFGKVNELRSAELCLTYIISHIYFIEKEALRKRNIPPYDPPNAITGLCFAPSRVF